MANKSDSKILKNSHAPPPPNKASKIGKKPNLKTPANLSINVPTV